MRLSSLAFLIISVTFLSGCSYIKKHTVIGNQAETYRSATEKPPLVVPDELKHSTISSQTETLPTNVQANSLKAIPMPPGSLSDQIAQGQVSKTVLNQKLPDPK